LGVDVGEAIRIGRINQENQISQWNPWRVLLQLGRELGSEDVGPNVTGTETETEGNTVLAFLEFVDEFDSGDHDSCVAERLETEHR